MYKTLLLSGLLISSVFADSYLGKPIHAPTTTPPKQQTLQKPIQTKSYSKSISANSPIVDNKNIIVSKSFREDHHRYDKRYRDFDYDDNAYYNDDGYYYGYYNRDGYFYDNIFFTYNSRYNYYDRDHHRGYFQNHYHHERIYEYHYVNDWNRVHCYREPNQRIYGHYYDRPLSYSQTITPHYRDTARMSTTRMQTPRRTSTHHQHTNHRSYNHRNYNNHNTHRDISRMSTRNSNSNNHHKKSTTHMQLAK